MCDESYMNMAVMMIRNKCKLEYMTDLQIQKKYLLTPTKRVNGVDYKINCQYRDVVEVKQK